MINVLRFIPCLSSVCLTGAFWFIANDGKIVGDEPPPNENQSTSERSDDNVVFRGRCVRSEDGQPVAGATVRFYPRRQHSSRDILSKIVKTDSQGRFAIEFQWDEERTGEKVDLPRSKIVITADGRASRVMLLGESRQETRITLSPPPTVRGRVIDVDNLGVQDVIVRVGPRSTPGLFDARADADGKFIVDDLPADLELDKDPRARQVSISHPAFGHRVKTVDRFPAEVDFKIDARVDVSRRKKIVAVSQYGDHKMVGGVEMKIKGHVFHGADVQTTAALRWPATKDRPALIHDVHVAADAFGNRDTWVMAWQSDQAILWVANAWQGSPSVRAVDFSDPGAIVYFYPGRWVGQTKDRDEPAREIDAARIRNLLGGESNGEPPREIIVAMSRVFPSLRESKKNDKASFAPPQVQSANYEQKWKVTGTVRDGTGQPISGVTVSTTVTNGTTRLAAARTEDDGTYKMEFPTDIGEPFDQPVVVRPVLAGHFERTFAAQGKVRLNPLSQPLNSESVALLGTQYQVNFQMLPAAVLSGQLPDFVMEKVGGGTVRIVCTAGKDNQHTHSLSADIDGQGRFRLPDVPVKVASKLQLCDANGVVAFESAANIDSDARHILRIFDGADSASPKPVFLIEPETPPVQVNVVHQQKSSPPPDDETAFGDLVLRWAESCQSNNTLAIKEHDPKVWEKVVAGYNVIHIVYDPPRKASVHTDDGVKEETVREIAFQMYEMRPGAIFALVDDETLVLEAQLINPSIEIVSHPAMKPFVSKWYQLRIDAWNNELPEADSDIKLATIDVTPGGVLSLDGKPLPKDIHKLGTELAQAGYVRGKTCVLIRATPQTAYEDLHWPIWKLWSMRWKNVVLRVADDSSIKSSTD